MKTATAIAALGLVAIAAAAWLQYLPRALAWFYLAASMLAMALYGIDKQAAIAGRRRIPEATLHGIALAGGWPGALLGQTCFRHKTAKRAFQRVSWLVVLINCSLLGWYVLN